MMDQGRALGIVAVCDGDVIAYGQITLWPHTAEISDLIVTELWRSKGIGTLLIHRLIEAARDWQMPLVEIGVALDNPRALALYQRLGFREARRDRSGFGKWSAGGDVSHPNPDTSKMSDTL